MWNVAYLARHWSEKRASNLPSWPHRDVVSVRAHVAVHPIRRVVAASAGGNRGAEAYAWAYCPGLVARG